VGKKKKSNDYPFRYHQEIELEITTLTNLGSGLGRVALEASPSAGGELPTPAVPNGGWVVMVPFTLPGERVRARVFRNHKNFSEADLITVITRSPHRVEPGCPLFGRCGGCQYQHLDYKEQLAWKQRQVGELLQHMAGVTFAVSPVIASPRGYGYRSKITPHFAAPRFERSVTSVNESLETSVPGAVSSITTPAGDASVSDPTPVPPFPIPRLLRHFP
jgi:tRNA/tmRNA/rRNA uracil-C5-methylase (TrmA/RlmC/RlmD family)